MELVKRQWLTQWAQAIAEVGYRLLIEVVVQVWRKFTPIQLPLLQSAEHGQSVTLRVGLVRVAGHGSGYQLRDLFGAALHVIRQHRDCNAIVNQQQVV